MIWLRVERLIVRCRRLAGPRNPYLAKMWLFLIMTLVSVIFAKWKMAKITLSEGNCISNICRTRSHFETDAIYCKKTIHTGTEIFRVRTIGRRTFTTVTN